MTYRTAKTGKERIAAMRERDALDGIRQLGLRIPADRHFIVKRIAAYLLDHPDTTIEGIQVRGPDGTCRTVGLLR